MGIFKSGLKSGAAGLSVAVAVTILIFIGSNVQDSKEEGGVVAYVNAYDRTDCEFTKDTVDGVEVTEDACQEGWKNLRQVPVETPYQTQMRRSAEEGQMQKWGSVEQHGGHHTVPNG